MKHLKVFLTHEDFLDFTESPDYILPNVSYCVNPESDNEPAHPDVHYNPQLRITYYIDPEEIAQDPAKYNTKSNVAPEPIIPEPIPEPTGIVINIISSNLTLSDYVKDVTIEGHIVPSENFDEGVELPIGEECTLLLTLNNVAEISADMFLGCTQITKVVIPDSVDTINRGAFNYCSNLKTIDLGNVTTIDNSSFCLCNNLSESSIELIDRINSGALVCDR